MIPRPQYELPPEKEQKLRKARRLEWVTIVALLTITAVMFLTMGSSQAMKTAWIEDVLSLIPPISFLIAMRYRDRPATEEFPYGHRRAPLLSFLTASVAVLLLGLYMLFDSTMALVRADHPTLGHFTLFGNHFEVWSGWVMIGALVYSMIPPVILGRMKLPLGSDLHEKTLHADASMNKADWMTAGAAILGILGIGVGLWWADAVAAGFISLNITKDGAQHVKRAMGDLMDRRPTGAESGEPLHLEERLKDALLLLPDVSDVAVRLREEGHTVTGEVFIVFRDQPNVARRVAEIAEHAASLDWRLYDLVVMPVEQIEIP